MTDRPALARAEELAREIECWQAQNHTATLPLELMARVLAEHETAPKILGIEVTQPNGQPLPAPCAIEGCHYDKWQAAEAMCAQLEQELSDAKEESRQWRVLREFSEKDKAALQAEHATDIETALAREVKSWVVQYAHLEAEHERRQAALEACAQFLDPDISRGPASYGWVNTKQLVEAALAPSQELMP